MNILLLLIANSIALLMAWDTKTFVSPGVPNNAYFVKYFTVHDKLKESMVLSQATDESGNKRYTGTWSLEVPRTCEVRNDVALVLKEKAKRYAVSGKFRRPFRFHQKQQLVVQYEVKFQEPLDCGGAYIKLLTYSPNLDLTKFDDTTPYTIMFGPDKCGNDLKLHFIYRIKNPRSGKFEERHTVVKEKKYIERMYKDNRTHLYTLVLNSDNSYVVYLDQWSLIYGSLLYDVIPPVVLEQEIDDLTDLKPADWDDRETIVDPSAMKPDDWDETQPLFVPDPNKSKPEGWREDLFPTTDDPKAVRPESWNEETQGVWKPTQLDNPECKNLPGCGPWSPPKVRNPLYKGTWKAPLIKNPAFKGVWKPRKTLNPHLDVQSNPFKYLEPVSAIGLELWSMTEDIVFDNFLITDNKAEADDFAAKTWGIKTDEENYANPNGQSVVDAIRFATYNHPWLWILIIGFTVGPVALFFYWLFKPDHTGSYSGYGPRAFRRRRLDFMADHSEEDIAAMEKKKQEMAQFLTRDRTLDKPAQNGQEATEKKTSTESKTSTENKKSTEEVDSKDDEVENDQTVRKREPHKTTS